MEALLDGERYERLTRGPGAPRTLGELSDLMDLDRELDRALDRELNG